MIRALGRLGRDRRGATIVEFALVAPVFILLLMGSGDLLHHAYTKAVLDGAIQKAARDSALQGGDAQVATFDAQVATLVQRVARNATWTSTRKSYSSFSAMKPEPFTDANSNGVREAGECFEDINSNSTWDTDPARDGQGGAHDVTLYTIVVTYPRLFPMAGMVGWPTTQTITSRTLLKNQPFTRQTEHTPVTICT